MRARAAGRRRWLLTRWALAICLAHVRPASSADFDADHVECPQRPVGGRYRFRRLRRHRVDRQRALLEVRHAAELSGAHKPGDLGLTLNGGVSREPDYLSWSLGAAARIELDPFFVTVEQTVGDAVHVLIKNHVRHVPVLREGVVVGILSDHDLQSSGVPTDVRQLLADAPRVQQLLRQPVSKLMTPDAITLTPDRDLGDAVDLIIEHRIGAIPIVDPGSNKLVGILSYIDALRALRGSAWG